MALLLAALAPGCLLLETPEERAHRVAAEFTRDVRPGGGVWGGDGSIESPLHSGGFRLTIGSNGTSAFIGPRPFFGAPRSLYCGEDRSYLVVGGEARELRASCFNELGMGRGPLRALDGATLVRATEDGARLHATFSSDGGVLATLDADWRDRVTRLQVAGPDWRFELAPSYGWQGPVDPPANASRVPAAVWASTTFSAGEYAWRAEGGRGVVDYADIRVEVRDGPRLLASFQPPRANAEAGFEFEFRDDGDAAFGSGDSFVLRNPEWTEPGQYHVVVWDEWAGAPVGPHGTPAPPAALLAAGVVAAALLGRRGR